MPATATIKGADKLLRKMQTIPAHMREGIREAMAEQAAEVVAMMKRLAPVLKESDPRREAGALRDSIGWAWGSKAPGGSMKLGNVRPSKVAARAGEDLTITIFAGNNQAFYARWVEFGTSKMAAHPYFYPSWRASRKTFRAKTRAAVRAAARQVAAS